MIFVKNNNLASAELRADQIANELGCKVYLDELPDTKETVVFVKSASPEFVSQAKDQGCKIVFDPIDTFSYPERLVWQEWYKDIDTVIAYNKFQANAYKRWFNDVVVIPHQWDVRITKPCPQDEFRPGYIGYSFNLPKEILKSGIGIESAPEKMLSALSRFNCHVSIRDGLQAKMKPATKVVSAAAVGAVIITTKDESALELLPNDYPYWVGTVKYFQDVLENAAGDFGGPTWNRALEMMAEVKEKTSVKEIAKLYDF